MEKEDKNTTMDERPDLTAASSGSGSEEMDKEATSTTSIEAASCGPSTKIEGSPPNSKPAPSSLQNVPAKQSVIHVETVPDDEATVVDTTAIPAPAATTRGEGLKAKVEAEATLEDRGTYPLAFKDEFELLGTLWQNVLNGSYPMDKFCDDNLRKVLKVWAKSQKGIVGFTLKNVQVLTRPEPNDDTKIKMQNQNSTKFGIFKKSLKKKLDLSAAARRAAQGAAAVTSTTSLHGAGNTDDAETALVVANDHGRDDSSHRMAARSRAGTEERALASSNNSSQLWSTFVGSASGGGGGNFFNFEGAQLQFGSSTTHHHGTPAGDRATLEQVLSGVKDLYEYQQKASKVQQETAAAVIENTDAVKGLSQTVEKTVKKPSKKPGTSPNASPPLPGGSYVDSPQRKDGGKKGWLGWILHASRNAGCSPTGCGRHVSRQSTSAALVRFCLGQGRQ